MPTLDEFFRQNATSNEEYAAARERARAAGHDLNTQVGGAPSPPGAEPTLSAPAAKPPESFMRRAARFDIGRDAITPALTGLANALLPSDEKVRKLNLPGAGGLNEGIAKAVVPQTPAQGMLAATPLVGNLTAGAGKLLRPALARIGASTGAGAAGGALGPEGVAGGAAMGAGSGVLGEAGGYVAGKLARSAPGAERSIAGGDQRNVVQAMREALTYNPTNAPSAPSLIDRLGINLADPRTLQQFAVRGRGADMLQQFMRARMKEIDQRVGPIVIEALGPERRMPSAAWDELSNLGRRGYQGPLASPNTRTGANVDLRQVWRDGMDQIAQQTFQRDASGLATGMFDEARRVYSTGMSYMRGLSQPSVWAAKGDVPYLDVPKLQEYVNTNVGKLASETAEGAIKGGKMQEPGRRVFRAEEIPQPPGMPSGPAPAAPPPKPGQALAREGPGMEYDPSQRAWIMAEPPALPPNALATRGGGAVAVPRGSGAPSTPRPTRPPAEGPVTEGAPGGPQAWDVGMYERMPGSDFAPFERALYRGAGVESKGDKDWIAAMFPGGGLGGIGRIALRGLNLLPNVGRTYVGQTPRTLPGGAQQAINYELLKAIQGLTGSGEAPQ